MWSGGVWEGPTPSGRGNPGSPAARPPRPRRPSRKKTPVFRPALRPSPGNALEALDVKLRVVCLLLALLARLLDPLGRALEVVPGRVARGRDAAEAEREVVGVGDVLERFFVHY